MAYVNGARYANEQNMVAVQVRITRRHLQKQKAEIFIIFLYQRSFFALYHQLLIFRAGFKTQPHTEKATRLYMYTELYTHCDTGGFKVKLA